MATVSCDIDSRDGGAVPPGQSPVVLYRAISRTTAFRTFQRAVGDATLHLNTVAVGLEAITACPAAAQRAAKTLNVGWRSPTLAAKALKDAPGAEPLPKRVVLPVATAGLRDLTSRSKIFVLRAVLVTACDSLDTYIAGLARTPWLKIDRDPAAICTKAVTKSGGIAWSLAERFATLCKTLNLKGMESSCAIIALGSRWRNALVHAEDAEFELSVSDRNVLMSPDANLKKAGFDIGQALCRFDSQMNPTLKDVTTIIAYAQDLCTAIDQQAIQCVASDAHQVEELLRERLMLHFRSRGRVDDFWGIHREKEWDQKSAKTRGQDRTERASGFDAKWLSRFDALLDAIGFSATKTPASARLSDREIGRLRSMSAKQFADELRLP